jgi:hypothetical protein
MSQLLGTTGQDLVRQLTRMLNHCHFISSNSRNELFASIRNKGSRMDFFLVVVASAHVF